MPTEDEMASGADARLPLRWIRRSGVVGVWLYVPLHYCLFYSPFIVPRLGQWQSIPMAWQLAGWLPLPILLALVGWALPPRHAALHALGAALLTHSFGAVVASLSMPGFLKSDATESPSTYWTLGLTLRLALFAVPLIGAALARRAAAERVPGVAPAAPT